jgi:hypothetical protein
MINDHLCFAFTLGEAGLTERYTYAVVPEPASMTMIGAGAMFLGGFAYLHRRRQACARIARRARGVGAGLALGARLWCRRTPSTQPSAAG